MAWSGLHVPSSAKGGIVTIGNFDGVHLGHQSMLTIVREHARKVAKRVVVVTFDPHPVNVLKPDVSLPKLSTLETRKELLKRFGADDVCVLNVDHALLSMAPETFFDEVVRKQLDASGLVEGPDFHFGKDRAGDTTVLKKLCDQSGLSLTVIPAVCEGSEMISSTRIRKLLADGAVAEAVSLLGHGYTISGVIGRGAGRGQTLGIPTANLERIEVLLPRNGVYAAQCSLQGQKLACAVSIGPNPTFDDHERKVECHILNFSGDLYDSDLSIELLAEIRELHSFASHESLVSQIKADINQCRQVVAEFGS